MAVDTDPRLRPHGGGCAREYRSRTRRDGGNRCAGSTIGVRGRGPPSDGRHSTRRLLVSSACGADGARRHRRHRVHPPTGHRRRRHDHGHPGDTLRLRHRVREWLASSARLDRQLPRRPQCRQLDHRRRWSRRCHRRVHQLRRRRHRGRDRCVHRGRRGDERTVRRPHAPANPRRTRRRCAGPPHATRIVRHHRAPRRIPADAAAVSVNVTSVWAWQRGFLSGYAAGDDAPSTSFLNVDGSGAAVAASVILPVSPDGFTIRNAAGGRLVIDVVGYFTGPTAPASADGLFVFTEPTRLLDTRKEPRRLWAGGVIEIASPNQRAAALVTNMTVARSDGRGFVAAYPAGRSRPVVSSLNTARRDQTIPNAAITPLATRGIGYYASTSTDLVVDTNGYFTGTPVRSTLPVPANTAVPRRVLMVGDSTLAAVRNVPREPEPVRRLRPGPGRAGVPPPRVAVLFQRLRLPHPEHRRGSDPRDPGRRRRRRRDGGLQRLARPVRVVRRHDHAAPLARRVLARSSG